MKAADCNNLAEYLGRYKYQPKLTEELDRLAAGDDFDQSLVNKIVLWKVNRYAPLSPETLQLLNAVKALKPGQHKEGREALAALLGEQGVDLPMASTLLRFRNPNVFQIIDRHAYRAVYGASYPLYPTSDPSRKILVYFDYLDQLVPLSKTEGVAFRDLDRALYMLDKEHNGRLNSR